MKSPRKLDFHTQEYVYSELVISLCFDTAEHGALNDRSCTLSNEVISTPLNDRSRSRSNKVISTPLNDRLRSRSNEVISTPLNDRSRSRSETEVNTPRNGAEVNINSKI